MDKKKVIGLIIFVIALPLFIFYPEIQEYRHHRLITAMINDAKYQEAYDLIDNEKSELFNFEYMSILKCEIGLGNTSRAQLRLDRLFKEERIDLIQGLIDEMGAELGEHLMYIDEHFRGLVFSDELKEELAQLHYDHGNKGRAMELRGVEEVDSYFMEYLSQRGDFFGFIEYYDKVPTELKEQYLYSMNMALLHQLIISKYEERDGDVEIILDELNNIDLPQEVSKSLGIFLAQLNSEQYYYNEEIARLASHPFCAENPYFNFTTSLFMLEKPEERDKAIVDLRENKAYNDILGREEIIEKALNSYQITHLDQITKGGIMAYYNSRSGMNYYNIKKEKFMDIPEGNHIRLGGVSPNRDYMIGFIFDDEYGRDVVLDKELNVVFEFEDSLKSFILWIDNETFRYHDYSDLSDSYIQTRQYNVTTGEDSEFIYGIKPYLDFEPLIEGARIWATDGETYTSIEPKGSIPGYYTVRDIETHGEIEKIEFDFTFLGSCEDYIYGMEMGVINSVVKLDKESREKTELPFYSIVSFHPYMEYIGYLDLEAGQY